MKTRKYKDNQQRKKFTKNESHIYLIQYFKKMKGMNILLNSNAVRSELEISEGKTNYFSQTKAKTSDQFGGTAFPSNSDTRRYTFDYKKWSDFGYPKSLSKFFLDRPSLKIEYFLTNLKSHSIYTDPEKASSLSKFAINDLALKICYSKKGTQQQSKARIRGRCIQSNRPRSVSRLLRLSRIRTRTLALEGKITGCTRSTW